MTSILGSCFECETGKLHLERYTGEFTHKGSPLRVPNLERCICDKCGADPILEEQYRENYKKITDEKRKVEGLLTSDEILKIRNSLNLTQLQAAKLIGGGRNAFSKYERGEVIQSVAMDNLLRVLNRHPECLKTLGILVKPSKEISHVSALFSSFLVGCHSINEQFEQSYEDDTTYALDVIFTSISPDIDDCFLEPMKIGPNTVDSNESQERWQTATKKIFGLKNAITARASGE